MVLKSARCGLSLIGLSVASLVASAQSATPPASGDTADEQLAEITITGSRIRKDAFTSASPIQIITSERSTLEGLQDRPQVGHADGEALTYMKRAGRADDFGANGEMTERFFAGGEVDAVAVRRAAPGGDRDLQWLLAPSPERALRLDRAYLGLVRAQRFALGRDAFAEPPQRLHRVVDAGQEAAKRTWTDGRLHLAW